MKKIIRILVCLIAGLSFLLMHVSPVEAKTGWVKDKDQWMYYDEDGSPHEGWLKYKGDYYFFVNGYMTVSSFAEYDEKTGIAQYYLGPDGKMVTGFFKIPTHTVELPMYFNKNGSNHNGWISDGTNWYYTDNSYCRTTPLYPGTRDITASFYRIDGKIYAFDRDGKMYTGWFQPNVMLYKVQEETEEPFRDTLTDEKGFIKTKKVWVYANSSGAVQTGWKKIDGVWYYLEPVTRWWFSEEPEIDLGSSKAQCAGAMVTGWKKISGKWYYFTGSGAMVTGWRKISGKWYYFLTSGAMKTGWYKENGNWYYLDSDGAMLANTSKKIGGKTYNFNSSGVCTNP